MTENQRKLKKAFIVGIILFFTAVAFWLLYKPEEQGCFNGIKDIGEKGIDCGGFCDKVCPPLSKPPQVQDISIEWVKYVKDGENNYDLIAKLSNDNERWGVSKLDYKFIVYNKEGRIIGAKKDYAYVMPKGFLKNEVASYIIEDNFKVNEDIGKTDLELSNFNWEEIKDPRDLPDLSRDIIIITDKNYGFVKNGEEFYYASGVTKNVSKYGFFKVDIYVVLFNINDEPIAAGKTDQWTMKAGEGWEFKIFWTNPLSGEVIRVDYGAQTNIFSSGNFMKAYGTGKIYTVPR